MDLHLQTAQATAEERAAVDAVLGAAEADRDRTGRQARDRRHLLLPALHAIQDRAGWISEGALTHVCARLAVAPADAYGVAAFYARFSLTPRAPRVVHVCDDLACRLAGAEQTCEQLERRLGPAARDGRETWVRSPCLGQCDRAPAALLVEAGSAPREAVLAPADAEAVMQALEGAAPPPLPVAVPQQGDPELRLLRRLGVAASGVAGYRAAGGYAALRTALDIGPDAVIAEVTASGLLGRGGAAFPCGAKWAAVARQAARPHHLVCNADESEPGTFKDRALIEGDPFALIESLTIAGYATGCEHAFVYLRGEYANAHEILDAALADARGAGLLGADILGSGIAFDVEVRRGASAYICGEETAIFNSIEGFRGEPRPKPPYPVVAGLFGRPTVVNNVETLVNVLDIVVEGGAAYAARGTPESTGTKLFSVSGHVARPGVYEMTFGATLGELLELAGGVPGGRPVQAVLLGGAAGVFVGPSELELPLTFEATRAAGATLGSGAVTVFDDTADLPALLRRIAAFFREESCGQCVPCRVGTVRQEEALARLGRRGAHRAEASELTLLREVGQCMRDASICGLGATASNAVLSAIDRLGVYTTGPSA
jgi:NADH-quinone oxidoreductase subunit F